MARAYLTLSFHAGYCGALSIHLGLSVKLQALVVSFFSVGLSVNSITNCSVIAHHPTSTGMEGTFAVVQ